MGRRPTLSEHQQQEARQRLANGETYRNIAKSYQVHHSTISRLAGKTNLSTPLENPAWAAP
jgi:transposase